MRTLIVDMTNQFIRSWIVVPALSMSGEPTGGIVGSLKILQKVISKTNPDRVIIVWDGAGGSQKRRAQHKGYKEGRKPLKMNYSVPTMTETDYLENRRWQQARLVEYINELPFMQFMYDGVEADDVIACVCSHLREEQKIILSADHDMMQLVDSNTLLYKPSPSKKKEDVIMNIGDVVELYGIHPNNFALAKAIVGDKSDNVKGVSGVGFIKLVKSYPEFANEETIYINDVVSKASRILNETKKPLKIHSKLATSGKLIKDNYDVVQLANPLVSARMSLEIKKTLEKFECVFNMPKFTREMKKDKIDMNFYSRLVSHCNIISNKWRKNNK